MPASMTGFGCAASDASFGRLIVEIQSVNRKYLEILVFLPKELTRFEHEVRTWVAEKITRGQIAVRFYLFPSADTALGLLPDLKALRSLKRGWEKIAKSLGYDPKTIDLSFLLLHSSLPPAFRLSQDQDLLSIEKCLKEALQSLLIMRSKEGKALSIDIKQRLVILKKKLRNVELLAPQIKERMKKNILEKVKELQANPEFSERVMREWILLTDRMDVSEEVARLKSHFEQFSKIFHARDEPVGRRMDFFIQEMGREVNTIGSKSFDAKVSHLVIEMKSELEKMREQIQNIE